MAGEIPEGVGEGVVCGPADVAERRGWAARSHGDQPVTAVSGGAEHRRGGTERGEGLAEVRGTEVGDVGTDECDSAARESAKGSVHALAEIAGSLAQGWNANGRAKDRAVGGQDEDGAECAIAGQGAQEAS